jgi:hypothetical protein
MLSNLLKIVATILGWLLSDKATVKRESKAREATIADIKDELIDGDADAVTARIDRLLNKSSGDGRSEDDAAE